MPTASRRLGTKLLLTTCLLLFVASPGFGMPQIDQLIQNGDKIIIIGEFDPRKDYTVDFGGTNAANVTVLDPTIIQVDLPADAKAGDVTVTDSTGAQAVFKNQKFTLATISAVIPASGTPGSTVIIRGANFYPEKGKNIVRFNGVDATVLDADESSLVVAVPHGATTGLITWIDKERGGAATSSVRFEVPSGEAPIISAFLPDRGPTGTTVTIIGRNFDKSARVFFKNEIPAKTLYKSGTEITAVVPPNAVDGIIRVTTGSGERTTETPFTVTGPEVIVEPLKGVKVSSVRISGGDFKATDRVRFNGVPATHLKLDGNALVALVPQDAQSGPVTVDTSAASFTSKNDYEVLGALRALHLYGGSTINFFERVSGTDSDTKADVAPLVGLIGVHRLPMCYPFAAKYCPQGSFKGCRECVEECPKDAGLLLSLELAYKGVAAERLAGTGDGGTSAQGLASASSIGSSFSLHFPLKRVATFSLGPTVTGGLEFLTDEGFEHDSQYSYAGGVRIQNEDDPFFFGQAMYGKTEYLSRGRLRIEGSIPLMTALLRTDRSRTSFYDKDFTDIYFFMAANISVNGTKDDSLLFGIKGVLALERVTDLLNPNKTLTDKANVKTAAK